MTRRFAIAYQGSLRLQEASATNFEYFASGYASAALQGVDTYFYPTAEVLPFRDDFTGSGEHPVSDPTGAGGWPSHMRPVLRVRTSPLMTVGIHILY